MLPYQRQRTPTTPGDRELMGDVRDVRAITAGMPTYGYRLVHANLRRNARKPGVRDPMPSAFTES